MNASSLINRDERVVSPYDSVESAEDDLLRNGYLVVKDKGEFIGIVIQSDVLALGHELVIDCVTPKPSIAGDVVIEEAARVMMEARIPYLPVTDSGGAYLGCVSHDRIFMELSSIRCAPVNMTITNIIGGASAEESKESFINQLTHHLKNPLQVIRSSVSLVRETKGDREKNILLDSIDTSVRNIDEIINNLLSEYS